MNKLFVSWWKEIDHFNFLIFIILIIIGIILSFSINNSASIIQKHFFYALISIVIIIFLSFLDLKTLRRFALVGLIISTWFIK